MVAMHTFSAIQVFCCLIANYPIQNWGTNMFSFKKNFNSKGNNIHLRVENMATNIGIKVKIQATTFMRVE